MPRFERRAAARASDRVAGAVGGAVAALIIAVALLTIFPRLGGAFEDLEAASDDVALAIARAVSEDVGRAIRLGIPLDRMRGVEPYLDSLLAANPSVSGIAILDRAETVLYASGEANLAAADRLVRMNLAGPNASAGAIVVQPSGLEVARVRAHIVASVAAIALIGGMLAGLAVRFWRLEKVDLPLFRFLAGGRAVARGVFADFTPPPPGSPLRPLGQWASRLIAPVRRGHRRLLAVVDEVRALDTAQALGGRIDRALAPLAPYRFDRPFNRRPSPLRLVWWPLAALACAEAIRPLKANFALDRIGNDPIAALAMAGATGADAAGALLGVAVGAWTGGRFTRPLCVTGMLLAAAAIAAVTIERDAVPFLVLMAVANFAVWLSVLSALSGDGSFERRPFMPPLVLLAAWALGPAVGALLAETEGRRLAFATIGGLTAIVGLLSLAEHPRRPAPYRPRQPLRPAEASAALAAGLALFAWADIHLAGTRLLEDYAGLALHFALAGAASLLAAAAGARLPAPVGAALAAAVLAGTALANIPAFVASTGLGLATGIVVLALGARALSPVGLAWLLSGGLVAAALQGLMFWLPADGLVLSAGAAALAAVVSVCAALVRRGR